MRKFTLTFMMLLAFAGFTMAQTMETFESLKMNLMAGGAEDLSSFAVVPNPDPSGINLSSYVVKFVRDKDGVPYGGFYGTLPEAIDFDTYNYVHVKVWKSRISPVKFKIEGGATGNIEIASLNTQTVVDGWEDMVFDFTDATGPYTKIVFMPDFLDPVGLTDDHIIYFDDFVVNNDPNPAAVPEQVLNVDMSAAGLTLGQQVFVSGALGGIYGTWNEPGTNANNEMLDPDEDGIYSVTLNLPDGIVAFKFFKGAGWDGGDTAPGGDRTITIAGGMELTYKFGDQGIVSQTSDDNVILENFESLKMNLMAGGADDLSTFTVVQNPDPTGTNLSSYVVEFLRDMNGVPWGGFYATLTSPIDLNTNKYVHVKVWKSRISPIKFKLEGTTNLEIFSINPQTEVAAWEDMVFDFSALSGDYTKIVFMPDFEDPLTLTEDITIYFDDFVANNNPNPAGPPAQVINVDMSSAGLTEGQQVFISGALGGIYGTWNEPGTNLNNEMFDTDGDGIYTITLSLPDGIYAFKFFKGTGWNLGDTAPGGDRTYTVSGDVTLTYKFGLQGLKPTMDDMNLIKDGHFSTDGPIASPWGTWSGNGGTAAIVDGVCVMTPGAAANQWDLQVNQLGNNNGWRVGNDSSYVLMFDAWSVVDRAFAIDFEDSNNSYKRFGLSWDPDAVNGESEWQVNVTTTPTTYSRVVKFNSVKANTNFLLNIMPSAQIDVVNIDNIYLIYLKDLGKIGTAVTSITVTGDGNATTIDSDKGTLQMMAEILPDNATLMNIAWSVIDSVDGTGSATINASGLLTASGNGKVTVKATSKDWTGVSGSLDVMLSNQTLGVSSNLVKSVNIYPNPAVNELNVSHLSSNAKVAIYNSVGSKLTEVDVQGAQAKFDVSNYARGIYFVKVNNETVGKFVK